ncbi:MAG TPA: hypothetical protein EYP79_05250, partial [Campylobacterales bacterium]|nr:hypothetical protein [Campylobacterales bacterium]
MKKILFLLFAFVGFAFASEGQSMIEAYSVIRKSKLSQSVGEEIIQELISLNVLSIEKSRETPLSSHPKNKIKKHLRSYRIQDKLRFTQPF